MGVWERRYYRVLNAVMRVLLRSPLHRLRSERVLLLEFRGRQTGRRYRLPVSFWPRSEGELVCLTSASWSRWWRNLDDRPVVVWLRGERREARAELIGDPARRQELVAGFLAHNVHDAHHYEVPLAGGRPERSAVSALARSADTKVIRVLLAAGPGRSS
jgi:hypothetical protein